MKTIRARRVPWFRIIVVTATALLWVIVASVQYEWVRQLSAVTQVRMGANLQTLMTQWHRDLYDELSSICIALQVGPDSGAHDVWNDYLQRYAEWNQNAAKDAAETASVIPDLVQEIYEWRTSGPGDPELLRLNPAAKTLDPVSVPPGMAAMLNRLRGNSANLQAAMRAWEYRNPSEKDQPARSNQDRIHVLRPNALAGWQLDDRIPALVHPIVHHADPSNSQTAVDLPAVDWLVVVLKLDVIQNRILPELANRYFSGPDGLDYKLAVVDTDSSPRVIYSSDPTLKLEDVTHFDSIMNIFSSSSTTVRSEFWQKLRDSRNLQEKDWRNFSAPGWFPVVQYGSAADEPWVLVLQHRTQPVSQIAQSVGRRNLLIGGVVLLLLAANIGLILFASHRAEKLATAQMEFVAAASHELLTPLSAIYCSGQNAKDGLLQTKSDLIAHGTIITTQARQLIDLVKQNLMFAATESNTNRFVLRPLQVSEILQSVRKNVAFLAEEDQCTIEYQVQPELPTVMGDLTNLTHCMQNLIVNAIKYGGKNGKIDINASLYGPGSEPKEVRISVRDHGPGISKSELRHIFDPFYRSPGVVEARIHGTGLGLTVAARIAAGMGGRLSVVSHVGEGSTFTLHLPAGEKVAETRAYTAKTDASVPR